jgi:hypothetical protein
MKNKFYLALVLVALMCPAGWTTYAQLQKDVPAKQTWEYLEVELIDPATSKLNHLGAEGWELVQVTSVCTGTPRPGCRYWAYMKRPK